MHEHRLPRVKLLHAFCRLVVGLLLAHQLLLLELLFRLLYHERLLRHRVHVGQVLLS